MSERENIDMDLGALIDGELNPDRRAEVEAWVKADPAAAERLARFREDKEKLRRIFDPVARRPIPREWLAIANGRPPKPKTSWRMVGSIAAVLLVAIFAAVSYVELRPPVAGEVVQAALDARRDVARPDRIITVADNAELDHYTGALRAAVKLKVSVPDMRKAGYRLTGIRTYAHGAAELSYRDRDNRVLTLYVRRSDGSVRTDQFPRDGLRVCIWQDDEVAMVAAGDMSTAAMQRLAVMAYNGLIA